MTQTLLSAGPRGVGYTFRLETLVEEPFVDRLRLITQVGYTLDKKDGSRMPRLRRSLVFAPLIVVVCSLAGGLYGPQANAAADSSGELGSVKM